MYNIKLLFFFSVLDRFADFFFVILEKKNMTLNPYQVKIPRLYPNILRMNKQIKGGGI